MFPDGHIGQGGPYDGIVTLNSAQPFWFTRPLISGSFDAQRATEHEIDEAIGLGSYLNGTTPCPSYEAEALDNTITGGAGIESCPTCSGGFKVVYVGNGSGTLQFNNVTANATHSYVITIWYANGASTRNALLSVNGSPGTPLSFPSTGSFHTLGSIQTTITLNAGSNNTLNFSNPVTGNWAPDFDRIVVNCNIPPAANLRPQDLFSWSSPGVRNRTLNGSRYFSINSGNTDIVGFNQTPPGDFGDWLSEPCPQPHPYVQNAFACPDQFSDISATSPEGINLDVIGYDLGNAPAPRYDFNRDGKPDYLLYNLGTRQTAVWFLNNNVFIGGAFGLTLPVGWNVIDAADFNRDGRPDYALFNPSTRQTAIWYLSGVKGVTFIGSAWGPPLPAGWALVATGDFNNDGKPDYVIFNASTRQTAIWYLNNNVVMGGAFGPAIPVPWILVGVADFNGDGKSDYLLFNPSTHNSVIWYLSGTTRIGSAFGPTIVAGYNLSGTDDFNRDGKPDYLLFNPSTRQTAIWYLNNNARIGTAAGPTLAIGFTLAAP
jgi:Alpha-galactosidase, CBM13 domain/FG-GAP-like repeat